MNLQVAARDIESMAVKKALERAADMEEGQAMGSRDPSEIAKKEADMMGVQEKVDKS